MRENENDRSSDQEGDRGSRDVVVPLSLYKTVTVFSTLIAVVAVVVGFVLLDAATQQGGIIRMAVGLLAAGVGIGISPARLVEVFETFEPVFALLGLGAIGFGAGIYVLGSRFRAEGMVGNGNAQDDDD